MISNASRAMNTLSIKNLSASIEKKEILKGVTLDVKPGEIHVLMGPNGSGKSTLANLLMGKPEVTVTGGTVTLDGENLLALPVHERARRGLFLGFQYPLEIPGVTIRHFLRLAKNAAVKATNDKTKIVSVAELNKELKAAAAEVGLGPELLTRDLGVGFSGGEKKRLEMLQLLVLHPKFAILDETDSGLDIDALKTIVKTIKTVAKEQHIGVLLITHYTNLLKELNAHAVHVFVGGRIVKSGGKELAEQLERNGYEQFQKM